MTKEARKKSALRDKRGVVYVETLVAFVPVFTLFLATLQLADLSAANLIVRHASTVAARAAAVVLPDDGVFYGDRDNQTLHTFTGLRQTDIEQAANLILRANPRLDAAAANVSLDKPTYRRRDDLTATVRATYRCLLPLFCPQIVMTGESKLVYQGAEFVYEATTLGDFGSRPNRPPDGQPVSDAPPQQTPNTPPNANTPPNPNTPPSATPNSPQQPTNTPPAVATGPNPAGPSVGTGTPRDPSDPSDPSNPASRPGDGTTGPTPPIVADNGRPPSGDLTGNPTSSRAPVDLTKPSPVDVGAGSPRGPPMGQPGPITVGPGSQPACTGMGCTIPGQCFAAGTLVHTSQGDRPIESLVAGDLVWSRSDVTGELALKPITRTFVNPDATVLPLELAGRDHNESIVSTPSHPFWVEGEGWKHAEALGETALLWSPEGSLTGHAGAAWPARTKGATTAVRVSPSTARSRWRMSRGAWRTRCGSPPCLRSSGSRP
ncbi:MAG: hypothetical protein RLZZ450_1594 [Pseudomonadota bacterium]|jgi:hypothetical protein